MRHGTKDESRQDIRINPSPVRLKVKPDKSEPCSSMRQTPEKPTAHPRIFHTDSFSVLNIMQAHRIVKNVFVASIMEAFTPLVLASPA